MGGVQALAAPVLAWSTKKYLPRCMHEATMHLTSGSVKIDTTGRMNTLFHNVEGKRNP